MIPWLLDDDTPLPDTRLAQPESSDVPGLLAAGGRLTTRRLAEAYSKGVFPWFSEGQPVLWWSPDPRMVLPVAEFNLRRSLRKTITRFINTPGCEVRIDCDFPTVIRRCGSLPREGQNGTWIVARMVESYIAWHHKGVVHSFETWIDDELVGGLYGVSLGRMFYGESMFSQRSDASKIALAALICFCRANGITLIDCQQNTRHLASMGAREISRENFECHLSLALTEPAVSDWTYHPKLWMHLGLAPVHTPPGVDDEPTSKTAA